jgi:hypothetical protein
MNSGTVAAGGADTDGDGSASAVARGVASSTTAGKTEPADIE